jgi:hypothetical protein
MTAKTITPKLTLAAINQNTPSEKSSSGKHFDAQERKSYTAARKIWKNARWTQPHDFPGFSIDESSRGSRAYDHAPRHFQTLVLTFGKTQKRSIKSIPFKNIHPTLRNGMIRVFHGITSYEAIVSLIVNW